MAGHGGALDRQVGFDKGPAGSPWDATDRLHAKRRGQACTHLWLAWARGRGGKVDWVGHDLAPISVDDFELVREGECVGDVCVSAVRLFARSVCLSICLSVYVELHAEN